MFDLTSSKLLILGVVALIVVGPKELPFLLRTIGKYVAMIRRQANEFRSQFDEAMREAELDSIRKDVEKVAQDAEISLKEATASVDREIHDSQRAVEASGMDETAYKPAAPVHTYDPLNGLDAGTPNLAAR
jgi:sec-independent protein translocase protein TatB